MKKYTQKLKNSCLILSVFAIWAIILSEFLHNSEVNIPAAIPFTIITIYVWRKFFNNNPLAFLSEDGLYDVIEEFVKERETITASVLQRKFKIGYARAASVLDSLEENGIIDSGDGLKPRKIIKQD